MYLDPPGTYTTVSPSSPSKKVRLDLQGQSDIFRTFCPRRSRLGAIRRRTRTCGRHRGLRTVSPSWRHFSGRCSKDHPSDPRRGGCGGYGNGWDVLTHGCCFQVLYPCMGFKYWCNRITSHFLWLYMVWSEPQQSQAPLIEPECLWCLCWGC